MKKIIFLPIFVFLILATVLYGLIPFLSRARLLSNDLNKQIANLEQANNYFANLKNIAAQIEQNQEILTNVERALPNEFSVPSLMSFFQLTAAENGLLLRNFDYEEVVNAQEGGDDKKTTLSSKIKEAVFHLTLQGSLTSFLSFIKSLEISSRLLEVSSIDFQTSEDNDVMQFNIAVKVYSY